MGYRSLTRLFPAPVDSQGGSTARADGNAPAAMCHHASRHSTSQAEKVMSVALRHASCRPFSQRWAQKLHRHDHSRNGHTHPPPTIYQIHNEDTSYDPLVKSSAIYRVPFDRLRAYLVQLLAKECLKNG